jgi:RNA polymerase sigma factor (sigma-70 family)
MRGPGEPEEVPVSDAWWAERLPRVREFVRRRLRPELARLESPTEIVQSACRELLEEVRRSPVDGLTMQWRLARRALRKIVQKHRYHAARKRGGHLPPALGAVDSVVGSTLGPLESLERDERAQALGRAMMRLPERYQRVIEAVHFDRRPHAEVGRELGCSEDASKMLLSRAMARLAEELARG